MCFLLNEKNNFSYEELEVILCIRDTIGSKGVLIVEALWYEL